MEFFEVDGSYGEGGGQTLRTALTFSAIKGTPIRVSRIRAGRREPGLKRQHLSVLRIFSEIFGAELTGASEGSQEVTFAPRRPRATTFKLDMGTAASIPLALQAIIPAAALSGVRLTIDLTGGTDVPWSPTFDYLDKVAEEAYSAVGLRCTLDCSARGYYPAGGGRVVASVEPCDSVKPVTLLTAEGEPAASVLSRCGGLPQHVANRQLETAERVLSESGIEVASRSSLAGESRSPGSSVLVWCTGAGRLLGSDSLGAKGKRAEEVGEEAAKEFAGAVRAGACVDSHLADMLVPLLSMSAGDSAMRVPEVSTHLETSLHVASQFTGCEHSVRQDGLGFVVSVSPEAQARSPRRGHNI